MKVALITGISGHVGSYLAEFLIEKGYSVHGIIRRSSNFTTERIDHIFSKIQLHYGDMMDQISLINVITTVKPDEIYNLAAQSHVKVSDELSSFTMDTNASGVLNLIQAIRFVDPKIKMIQASTSEMYGNHNNEKLNESSTFTPVSIYGISKLTAYHLVRYYREAYGLFLCNSISFNHESEKRGKTFVTRKISEYVKSFVLNKTIEPLRLGNLEACRDWSHTLDIVEGMYRIMNHTIPDDFVLSSGVSHSVREFVEKAFSVYKIPIKWEHTGQDPTTEKGVHAITRQVLVTIDSKYYRPIDIHNLIGDSTKAFNQLGWSPKISFDELVYTMTKKK